MKTILKLVITAFLVSAVLQVCAQGYLVPNGVTYAGNSPGDTLHVIQNPTDLDYTGFILFYHGTDSFSFGVFADEGVRVFLVSPNDSISLQPILSQNYTELSLGNSYVFANGSPFYVGLYTGYNPWIIDNGTLIYTGIYTDPVYGWAQLVNNNGVIELLDSALEYGGGGIYTGTQTIIPVPEPRTLSLAVIGAMLLGWRLRSLSKV